MKNSHLIQLSRRERQIMDVLYKIGKGTVSDVRAMLPDPPSYSAIRTLLGILEDKGVVRHAKKGRAYVYSPLVSRARASKSALSHVLQTFFDGSVEQVVAALVSIRGSQLSEDEYERLSHLISSQRHKEDK